MYKQNFPYNKALQKEINNYLLSKYPEEAGGIVVDNKFLPFENASDDKLNKYKIRTEDYMGAEESGVIQCIIHSHDNFPHASEQDMLAQEASGVPWGIVNIVNNSITDIFFWGDTLEPDSLVGRKFHHGVHDCYGLVRDYYRMEKGILLKNIPREYGWWKMDPPKNVLKDFQKECGFKNITFEEMQTGDVLLFKIRYDVVNHSAIYLDNGLMLHQFFSSGGALSKHEPILRWTKHITDCLRYTGEING